MQLHPDVVFRVLGDGAVLVNLASNEVFEFNDTGAAIWDHLSRGESIDEVVPRLMATFEVDRETAEHDVAAFVDELTSRGLLAP
jgi:hypothetical protein